MSHRNVLLALAVVAAAAYLVGSGGGRAPQDGAIARITRVVDGDTVHVELDGQTETVRYIGVDTPESVRPGTPVQCFAEAASGFNRRLVGGERVRLGFDVERRDRYGRLLAYVWRVRDGRFVNADLVRAGYARTLTIPPNVAYARRFAGLATEARRAGRGLWRAC